MTGLDHRPHFGSDVNKRRSLAPSRPPNAERADHWFDVVFMQDEPGLILQSAKCCSY